jgi:nucleoside-diphosphate-sugar epimerase
MKKKILITGANSPVGIDIIDCLDKNFYNLSIAFNKRKNLIKKFEKVKKIKIDLTKKIRIKKESFYSLVHLASATPFRKYDKKTYEKINLNGLRKILNHFNFDKIILLSTTAIYNVDNKISSETSAKNPKSNYTFTKLKMEEILVEFAKKHKKEILILRCPAILCKTKNNINFIEKLRYGYFGSKKLEIFNPDQLYNNLIDTAEISKVIIYFLKNKLKFRAINIFNLAASQPTKIYDVIKLILKRTKKHNELKKIYHKKKQHTVISLKKIASIGYKTKSLYSIIKSNI